MAEKVKKRDGRIEDFDLKKIENAIHKGFVAVGLKDKDKEKSRELALNVSNKIKKELPTVEEIQDLVEETLIESGLSKVARAYILYRRERSKIREEKTLLGVKDDLKLSVNAVKILKRRYLLKNDREEVIETPQELFRRVARSVGPFKHEKEFFNAMKDRYFLPNSPTLMNAGTDIGQLSACFVLPIEDSIESIFDTLKYMATIHKTGGGTGFSFSHLRPDRDMVGTTKGVASGPVSFMRIYDVATEVIKQGGRRRGANMGILNVSHPDILSFISSKVNGGFSNFNLSVSADDNFMKSVDNEYEYKLINPRNNEIISQVNSKELFDRICYLAWQTGDPGMIFLDEINRHNPTPELGMIEATNPCGEVPLLPFESCNLGSINLSEFVDKRGINWERLSDIIGLGVNFLDNVIDANRYPLKEIETIAKGNRKIGLGVMGFAEMLIRMRIPYNSEEAVDTAGRVMQFVNKKAEDASRELAKVKGSFPNIDKSIYKGGEMRNATRTSIAPTGSISTIAGTTSGIEPLFAIAYIREVLEGERLVEINPMFVGETKRMNLYSTDLIRRVEREGNLKNVKLPSDLKKLFVTSLEVEPEYHIKIQAAFQRYTDNAVSKTVNLPNSATVEDVKKIYKLAYKMKCKGITIFRQGSRQRQVLYEGGITERDLHACQRENCYL